MSAPKNNTYWKARSKHGRDKIFKIPKDLLSACYEYFEWAKNNPWYKNEFNSKANKVVQVPTERPLTLTGLYVFLQINRQTWENYKKEEDFLAVIEEVENIIYTQKFEGAAVGVFNSNIIVRDLGLKDSQNVKHEGIPEAAPPQISVYNVGPPLASSEDEIKD